MLPVLCAAARGPATAPSAPLLFAVREGFGFARHTVPVPVALLVLAVSVALTMNASTLLPAFAGQVFRAGPRGLGPLMAASGAGALTGTIAAGLMPPWSPGRRGLVAPVLLVSASLVAFSMARSIWLAAALMMAAGLAQSRVLIGVQRTLQAQAPERLRGRVMALCSQVVLAGVPLAALLAGAVARLTGAPAALAALAATAAVLVAALAARPAGGALGVEAGDGERGAPSGLRTSGGGGS